MTRSISPVGLEELHAAVVERINQLEVTSPDAAAATAQAYVDTLIEPVRTASLDAQNLIDAAEQDAKALLKTLRKTQRCVGRAHLLATLLIKPWSNRILERAADACDHVVRSCGSQIAAFSTVASSSTARATELGTHHAQLLNDDRANRAFDEGLLILNENLTVLAAQHALVENIRDTYLTSVKQLGMTADALRTAVDVNHALVRAHDARQELQSVSAGVNISLARILLSRTINSVADTFHKAGA